MPTYQPTPDAPDNYGCGVLSDGRILTTDIGNDAGGDANGQLEIWFPPYDSLTVSFCKIDTHLATGQAIYVDGNDDVYLNSPRPSDDPHATAGGIYKYTGPFPTSADAAGGCGQVDNLGSPLADHVTKTKVLSAGDHDLVSPSGLTKGAERPLVRVERDHRRDQRVRPELGFRADRAASRRPASNSASSRSRPARRSGSPRTTTATCTSPTSASSWYRERRRGPAPGAGSVNRITFTNGEPNAPEVMADGLQFPDGLGIWHPQ